MTWPLRDCARCGFVYIDKAPVYDELVSDFSWHKTVVHRNSQRSRKHPLLIWLSKRTRWRLHLFRRQSMESLLTRFVTAGNVVDVGCGKGAQLARLPAPFVPFGIEISQAEAAHAEDVARRRGGAVIVKPAIEGLETFPADFAAGIFMRSYLEHESNPLGVLEEVRRVLAPRGVAVIKVPNYGSLNRALLGSFWSGFRFPDHLNYFTPATLRAMCERAGLGVRRFRATDRLPLGDNMWLVAGKAAAPPRATASDSS